MALLRPYPAPRTRQGKIGQSRRNGPGGADQSAPRPHQTAQAGLFQRVVEQGTDGDLLFHL